MQQRMQQVDTKTGEILDGFVAYIAPKRTNGFGQRWIAMAQDAMFLLANSNELNLTDHKVLWALMAHLDFENLLVLNQAELARKLGKKRQHVQRSIKKLMEEGVILEGQKIGISRSYRLNPNYGWKGSAKNHHSALQKRMNESGLSVVTGGKTGTEEEQTEINI